MSLHRILRAFPSGLAVAGWLQNSNLYRSGLAKTIGGPSTEQKAIPWETCTSKGIPEGTPPCFSWRKHGGAEAAWKAVKDTIGWDDADCD